MAGNSICCVHLLYFLLVFSISNFKLPSYLSNVHCTALDHIKFCVSHTFACSDQVDFLHVKAMTVMLTVGCFNVQPLTPIFSLMPHTYMRSRKHSTVYSGVFLMVYAS